MKKIFVLFLAFFAFAFININVNAQTEEVDEVTYTEEILEKNKNSGEKHQQLMKHVLRNAKKSPMGEFIYPDSFAGAYIDAKGDYVVGYKEGYSEEEYSVILSANLDLTIEDKFQPKVKFVRRSFSFNELNEIYELLSMNMNELNIHKTFVNVKTNKVNAYIQNNQNRQMILSFLRENIEDFSPSKVQIFLDKSEIEFTSTRVAFNGHEIHYRSGFLNLGRTRSTIGLQAKDNITGQLGVITTGHSAPLGTTMRDGDGVVIGTPSKRQVGGTLDASFIPYANISNWRPTNEIRWVENGGPAGTYYEKVPIEGYIVVGRNVTKIGITTQRTVGQILATSVSITVSGVSFTNIIHYSNYSRPGDSGGPVFFVYHNTTYIMAVHFAGQGDGSSGYGCRASHIIGLFNLELYVIPDPIWW